MSVHSTYYEDEAEYEQDLRCEYRKGNEDDIPYLESINDLLKQKREIEKKIKLLQDMNITENKVRIYRKDSSLIWYFQAQYTNGHNKTWRTILWNLDRDELINEILNLIEDMNNLIKEQK